MNGRLYLTPTELVSRYNGAVSLKTLANWRVSGTGPAYTKVGGKILYRLDKIEEWERSRTMQSTAVKLAE